MRRVTLCLPYYMNSSMLTRQLDMVRLLPAELKSSIEVIVVDDGSPDNLLTWAPIGCPLKIFRIDIDIRWNQDAARNIAVKEAKTDWLLLTDIDHLVPRKTWAAVINADLNSNVVYRFSRMTLDADGPKPTLSHYKPHPNSWLMTRAMYEKIGGYDERFAGYYGTDADFRDRVVKAAPVIMLPDVIWRVPRTTIPDASTRTYVRKAPEDGTGMRRVKEERDRMPGWVPIRGRFPYRLIAECNR